MILKKLLLLGCALAVSVTVLAQNTFDSRYSAAESQYASKQYQSAITTLKNAKKAMGVTQEQKAKADGLIARCEEALRVLNRLILDVHDIKASYDGCMDTIHIVAGQAWKATIEANDWCAIQSMGNDMVVLDIQPNKTKETRMAQVQVKMGKQTDIIYVRQDPRPDTHRTVRIETDPEYAKIWVEGVDGRVDSPWSFDLPSGRHTIKIEKDGYAPKDTAIFIEDDLSEEAINLHFTLPRRFGRVSVKVEPEPGFRFSSAPVIELNHSPILMSGRRNRYESAAPIQYYTLYEDETIPVYPGRHIVTVRADNFKTYDQDYSIYENMDTLIHVVLEARTGLLSVSDMGNARGAEVYIDNDPVGTIPLSGYRVGVGDHFLTARKNGYLSALDRYPLHVQENKDTTVHVLMTRFGNYRFNSTPAGAKVYIDDAFVGETPVDHVLLAGEHQVTIKRNGYSDYSEIVDTEFGDELHEKHFTLMQTYPLTISCDIDSLSVVVLKDNEPVVTGVKAPVTVHLPFSKKNYRLELYRASQAKPVYWGPLSFREEGKTHHKVLTFSRSNFQAIGGDLVFNSPLSQDLPYSKIGNFRFLNFKLFTGLSTSLLKASLFRTDQGMEEIRNSSFVPAVSCLFLNYEFRMGGRILENLDICAIGEAAWYPEYLKEAKLPVTFLSGLEWFAGVELTSRIPIINANVKAGYQSFANSGTLAPSLWMSPLEGENLVQHPLTFPGAFVVSVGFSLGGRDSKGENMIRLF